MKIQIKRFSPHQNAKVFSVLMAVSSLIFIIPMALIMATTMPDFDQNGRSIDFPVTMILVMPIMYLIMTYIAVALGSVIYNFIVKHVGGIEYETQEINETDQASD